MSTTLYSRRRNSASRAGHGTPRPWAPGVSRLFHQVCRLTRHFCVTGQPLAARRGCRKKKLRYAASPRAWRSSSMPSTKSSVKTGSEERFLSLRSRRSSRSGLPTAEASREGRHLHGRRHERKRRSRRPLADPPAARAPSAHVMPAAASSRMACMAIAPHACWSGECGARGRTRQSGCGGHLGAERAARHKVMIARLGVCFEAWVRGCLAWVRQGSAKGSPVTCVRQAGEA